MKALVVLAFPTLESSPNSGLRSFSSENHQIIMSHYHYSDECYYGIRGPGSEMAHIWW